MAATIKSNWKLPKPPQEKCECGEPIIPCVDNTGDGWATMWDCENGCETLGDKGYMTDEEAWPFVEDWANYSDWEHAGFHIV